MSRARPVSIRAERMVLLYAGTVCESYEPGWYLVGGTSLATPNRRRSCESLLSQWRENRDGPPKYLQTTNEPRGGEGTAGQAGSNVAMPGYDKVMGVGVPASIQFVK
jgi:hypothetical protein